MSLRWWPRRRHDAVVFGSKSYPDELRDGKRGDAQVSERLCSILGDMLPDSLHVRELDAGSAPDTTPRLAMWPGVALTLVVYCLNMVGDALRDLLDPRLGQQRQRLLARERGGGGALAGGVGTRAAERAAKALQKLERSR